MKGALKGGGHDWGKVQRERVQRGDRVHEGRGRGVRERPGLQDRLDGQVLVVQEDHPHARDGGGRGEGEVAGLEDEVHVVPEGDALAGREGEQVVVVQDGVERFDPFGVDVAVVDYPGEDLGRLFDDLASGVG